MWAAAYPQPFIGRCRPAQPTSVIGFARFANVGPAGETAICKTDHRCRHRRSARRRSVPLRIKPSLRAGICPSAGLGVDDALAYVAVPVTIPALAFRPSRATSSIRHLFAGGCSLLCRAWCCWLVLNSMLMVKSTACCFVAA